MHRANRLIAAAALAAAVLPPAAAQAARNWVLPSTTVLSGPNAWITVDGADSDELYIPNLRPLPIDSFKAFDSEGQAVTLQTPSQGKFRSTFDIQLTKPGTYKIVSATTAVIASWTENGEVKRFRGSGEDFAKQVPAGAADLKTIRTINRSETYVTRDTPTTTVFAPAGEGLELAPVTHPSDVVVGEPATFKLQLDGKPAAGLEVLLMRGGDHWKVPPTEIHAKTGADGAVTVTLPEGGVWWLRATHQTGETPRSAGPPPRPPQPGGPPPAPPQALPGDGYAANYTVTFEALLP